MNLPYPTSINEIASWQARNGTTSDEARKRFVQFVVLECIGSAPWRGLVAFKGGNALRMVYENPRATIDLDFSASDEFPDDPERIREMLSNALKYAASRYQVKARAQKVNRSPQRFDATMPTYEVSVGYLLPGDRGYPDFESRERALPVIIVLEISINDVVCESRNHHLVPIEPIAIRVCTLEDILAEKLRALLQQKVRSRNRRQDVYDIARMVNVHGQVIDEVKISAFLRRKAAARKITPTRGAFDADIRERAAFEYETLFDEHDPDFIPFDTAWKIVTELVDRLDLPE